MMLSPHFALEEFTRSTLAARLGIDNTPPHDALNNLYRLAATLEHVRSLAGPVAISSGYRCPALNAAAHGSATSAHMDGRAADIRAAPAPRLLAQMIADSGIIFDQLILEFPDSGHGWVHVGIAAPLVKPRRELLTATRGAGGRTAYARGLA